jgi:hypothetical protein
VLLVRAAKLRCAATCYKCALLQNTLREAPGSILANLFLPNIPNRKNIGPRITPTQRSELPNAKYMNAAMPNVKRPNSTARTLSILVNLASSIITLTTYNAERTGGETVGLLVFLGDTSSYKLSV